MAESSAPPCLKACSPSTSTARFCRNTAEAAPINWAIIGGESETGVSVITLAQTMDAGEMLAQRTIEIGRTETAGELHDRMALLGPDAVGTVLDQYASNTLESITQDESLVTQAPKMAKDDGVVAFDKPAERVRCRINGLNPWPSCTMKLGDAALKLIRADADASIAHNAAPGTLLDGGCVACGEGVVQLLEVQPAGKKPMPFDAFLRGRTIESGARFSSM